ncbi:lanthionine synthetase LanC family protein [Streptomyces sp. NPDC048606]|uniref:lanthionine synthetase LanC family protein n=1 Tax=Streptomyces sp. NPDC048606 TaxID=3154726 RepID=UPI0034380C17
MTADRRAAADVALRIADALADPVEVARALPPDRGHTLCDGLAGTALLHAALADAVPGSAARALAHWRLAAETLGAARPDGVYRGPGGLAASLTVGAGSVFRDEPPGDAVRDAVRWLAARAQALAARAEALEAHPWPGPVHDVMSGLTGIGRVLLAAHGSGLAAESASGLTAALSTLTRMVLDGTPDRPGRWRPAGRWPGPVPGHPGGGAVTGMAHGIAGPLALLALAETTGPPLPGRRAAVRVAADWLVAVREGGSWPPRVTGAGAGSGSGPRNGRRDAWCYGAPGIARALGPASAALGDPAYARLADQVLTASAGRPAAGWDTVGPGLCHGSAGVLVCALRAGHRTLARSAARVTVDLAAEASRGPSGLPAAGGTGLGFLNGAAGTCLALAQYAGLLPRSLAVPWDCLLLNA